MSSLTSLVHSFVTLLLSGSLWSGPTPPPRPTLAAAPLAPLQLAPRSGPADPAEDRLYGRVVTASGDVLEGFIRWDKNEGSWDDMLDGTKEIPEQNLRDAERLHGTVPGVDHSFHILGLRISWSGDEEGHAEAAAGIRFGHLKSLTVLDDDRALLTLRSGREVELSRASTDIGTRVRGIEVEDGRHGTRTLRWDDVDVIEFMPPPAGVEPAAVRLYGTLEDRFGNEYTGWVAWDVDEILTTDVLDGSDPSGHKRKLAFGQIASIERASGSSARVTLNDGEEVVLSGSNDVNSSNRGIQISDPELGQVQVDWRAFGSLRFHAAPAGRPYDRFDGGHRLHGTVVTRGGERITGDLRWDNDEEWSWEILNGSYHGVVYEVEFGQVRHARRQGAKGATVTLTDGRVLELEESNDVTEDNKGLYVIPSGGETKLVSWDDVREVTFDRR